MRCYLKEGDEVVADNIKLIYSNGKFVVPKDGLDYCLKYVFDVSTELECELMFETIGENVFRPKPYYDKPEVD